MFLSLCTQEFVDSKHAAILTIWTAKPTRSSQPFGQPTNSPAHKSAMVHLFLPTKHGTLLLDLQKKSYLSYITWGLAILIQRGQRKFLQQIYLAFSILFSSISNQFLKCRPPIILPCAAYRRRRNNFTPGGSVMKNLSAVRRVEADRIGFLRNVSKFWLLGSSFLHDWPTIFISIIPLSLQKSLPWTTLSSKLSCIQVCFKTLKAFLSEKNSTSDLKWELHT